MKTLEAVKLFEALSSDVRLDLFRLLVKNAPQGLVAGDISKELAVPPTNLSFHLRALTASGLISSEKEGRFLRYRANIPLMLEVIAYLTEECCCNDPAQCESYRQASGIRLGLLPERS